MLSHRLFRPAIASFLAARARAHAQRQIKAWGLYDLDQRLLGEVGSLTLCGPFQGLQLSPMSWAEHVGPFLLGTYEQELHPWWREIFGRSFDLIVDVGSNFGYYAVGLAQRFPHTPTIAIDPDWWARAATREMAAANLVSNVSVARYSSPRWLARRLTAHTLIVSDCEGFEAELFDPSKVPGLAAATMIIETHEHIVPGVTSAIAARFSATHVVRKTALDLDTRNTIDAPVESLRRSFTPEDIRRAATEIRLPQEWLFLTPRSDS